MPKLACDQLFVSRYKDRIYVCLIGGKGFRAVKSTFELSITEARELATDILAATITDADIAAAERALLS